MILKNTPLRYTLMFLIISFSQESFSQNEARQVFNKATKATNLGNVEMQMNINTIDNKGRVKEKDLSILRAQFENEGKTKVIWQKPERAKGTIIIISDIPNQTGIIEVYTPSNGKKRKLKATEANMKMIGNEFNFSKFSSYDPSQLQFEFLEDTVFGTTPCYQLQVSGEKNGHSKALLVINKKRYSIHQITRFDEKNARISNTKLYDFKEVTGSSEGVIYPRKIIVEDLINHKKSTILINSIEAQSDLTPNDFELPN